MGALKNQPKKKKREKKICPCVLHKCFGSKFQGRYRAGRPKPEEDLSV